MPHMAMFHETDPAQEIWSGVGDLSGISVFNNKLILATYMRPEKSKGGLIMTDMARSEDRWQSKIGLLIKMGPQAFIDDTGRWFSGVKFELGDWLVYRPADGWNMEINGKPCRVFDDINIVGRVEHPDLVY